MDNAPKALILGGEEHNSPLIDISNLSERRRKELCSKALRAAGTYAYDIFKSDEEFEQAVACYAPQSFGKNTTEEEAMDTATFMRGFYYHKKKFRVWEKEVLEPMVKDLADYALNSPQYDNSYLLELEKKKLECMDAYFSHSVTADAEGNYPSARWIRLCIKLLGYLVNPHNIPNEQIFKMNIRNVGYPVRKWDLEHFVSEEDTEMKLHCGKNIYWHKAHRLYCHIREYSLHTWWD